MVLLASGIVDECPLLGFVMSVLLVCLLWGWVGVERRIGALVGGFDTLLGFEGSHSFVLVPCVGGGWVASFAEAGLLGLVGVLVGWVVDSWIVDASIFGITRASSSGLHQDWVGVWCRSL
jgi:hypothetical protein